MNERDGPDDDSFYEAQPPIINVKLSHLNNKSSVLCTKSQNITGQYLALQQLDAHQQMISRAKGMVDTSAPRSLQSYLSVANRQRKSQWTSHSKLSNFTHRPETSRTQVSLSEEEDNVSLNASSVSRAVQTGIPFVTASSKTADKISWYLEALSQGAPPFVYIGDSSNSAQFSGKHSSVSGRPRKTVNGDIVETHVNCFVQSKKPFSPRLLANNPAKSKIKQMRCYNPPFRRKKRSSANSSDTFESYDPEDEEDEKEKEDEKVFDNFSEDIETQINVTSPTGHVSNINTRLQDYLLQHNRGKPEISNQTENLNKNEDKYLDFLSKVTEDILRSGVYSDRAIHRAFEFHMQFYEEAEDKDKLQSLLIQVLENLKISSGDSDDVSSRRDPFSMSFSRSVTPPEKEASSDTPDVTNSLKNIEQSDLPSNPTEESPSDKTSPQHSFRIPES